METINNITSSASKVLWGEQSTNTAQSGTEPRAGEQGKGTATDPYDHGNEDQNPKDTTTSTTSHTTTGPGSNTNPEGGASTAAENREGPSEATSSDTAGDPSSGTTPTQKQQGADKPSEEPSTDKNKLQMPHSDEEREKLMEKGEFPHDPNDHSGEPLKMHGGGDAGDVGEGEEKSEKTERSKSVSQEGGNPHGKSMGTGEQYVKSSGMPADGGDFDASNPGAGQEATRLMEEKGIKTETQKAPQPDENESSSKLNDDKVKVSKLDKIKEKLHMKH